VNRLFVVRLDQQRYALRLQEVERVVRMVEITPLPEAPPAVLGLINVQGRVLSVVNLRRCFHLPPREVDPEDVLVMVQTARGMVALAVDEVEGVCAWTEQATVSGETILPAPLFLEGVVKLADGLVLICDLDQLLDSHAACSAGQPAAVQQGEAAPDQGVGDDR
jgi:purine-binding chemotaxis protein CheW